MSQIKIKFHLIRIWRYSYKPDDIDEPEIVGEISAHCREDAKELVRKIYPNATFYN